jgi:hypothetical protein
MSRSLVTITGDKFLCHNNIETLSLTLSLYGEGTAKAGSWAVIILYLIIILFISPIYGS